MGNTNNTNTAGAGNPAFFNLLSRDVRGECQTIEGMSYIPAWRAQGLAGMPDHAVVEFGEGQIVRRLFGGTAVAVDMPVAGPGSPVQRTYLPLLDMKGRCIPDGNENVRDVSDTEARCIARAIAIVHGLGLSLYSLTSGDGAGYVDAMGITPDTPNIAAVAPLVDVKEIKNKQGRVIRAQDFFGWHAAQAACRITDPEFYWEIREFAQEDGALLPAVAVSGGWFVCVTAHYKGKAYTLWHPILGVGEVQTKEGPKKMEHRPIESPTVMQWHTAVMRCLAKLVAAKIGYGLPIYAKGEIFTPAPTSDARPAAVVPQQQIVEAHPAVAAASVGLVGRINALLVETASEEKLFLGWLGVPNLAAADTTKLERGVAALESKLAGQREAPPLH